MSGDLKLMAISGSSILFLGDRASIDKIRFNFSFLIKCLFLFDPINPLVFIRLIGDIGIGDFLAGDSIDLLKIGNLILFLELSSDGTS